LLWKKSGLPESDAQYVASGTNPTGCLRLTQAKWKVDGKFIDKTIYFRNTVFGHFVWKKIKSNPFVEMTEVLFNVNILGKDLGQYKLEIRHKPSGEAGQSNYTTSLSWGELGEKIKDMDLRHKDFFLYAPIKGREEPFYIDIK